MVEKTHRLRQRLRLTRAFRRGCSWAGTGSLVALALVLSLKLAGRPWPELVAAFSAIPLFVLGGALASWLKPPGLLQAALEADRVLDTKERLTTAVEWIVEERPRTAVAQSLLTDALERMGSVDPARTFPLRTGANLKPAVAALAVGLVLTALPAWSLFGPTVSPEELAVRRSAQAIAELAETLPKTAEARRLRGELEELARQLREPGVGREEAAARIGKKRQELQSTAGGESREGPEDGSMEARAERLRRMARATESGSGEGATSQSIQQEAAGLPENHPARQSLEQARRALEAQDRQQVSDALRQAAQQCEGAGEGEEGGAGVDQALAEQQELLQPGSGQEEAASNSGAAGPEGQGQGEKPADFGRGTTNEEQPAAQHDLDYRLERQADDTSDWSEEYERLYAPRRAERETADTRVPGQLGQGGLLPAPGEVRGAPSTGGESRLDATEVYLQSRREAEQAVARESIPAEYRDTVRDYFDRIDPRPVPQGNR